MSNFKCPTCGFANIDCGKAGYKTDREIELEKKLDIAVKALEQYGNEDLWYNYEDWNGKECIKCVFEDYGYEKAQEALAKIKEIK